MVNKTTRFLTTVKKSGPGKDKNRKLSVLILNATPGYRMKSYGPKCLLKINNTSILEHQISIIKNLYSNVEIIVTIGFDADKILRKQIKGIRFVENQLYDTTNITEEIRLGLNNIETNDVIILYGDIVFNLQTIESITKNDMSSIIYTEKGFDDEVGITIVDNNLSIMSYGLNEFKWCKMMYLTGNELNAFKNICSNKENNRLYPFEIINMVLDKNNTKFYCINQSNSPIVRIDSIKDIKNENSHI